MLIYCQHAKQYACLCVCVCVCLCVFVCVMSIIIIRLLRGLKSLDQRFRLCGKTENIHGFHAKEEKAD